MYEIKGGYLYGHDRDTHFAVAGGYRLLDWLELGMRKKKIAAATASAVAARSLVSLPLLSQTPPDRPDAVSDDAWIPISGRAGLELVGDGARSPTDTQRAHLWTVGSDGVWRRTDIIRPVGVMPLTPAH